MSNEFWKPSLHYIVQTLSPSNNTNKIWFESCVLNKMCLIHKQYLKRVRGMFKFVSDSIYCSEQTLQAYRKANLYINVLAKGSVG